MRLPALRLAPREGRALALGVGVVVLGLLVRTGPRAVAVLRGMQARSDAAGTELARGRALLESQSILRDSLAARAGRLVALAPLFIAGATSSDANAELAGLVGAAAARHRVRITRQEARPETVAGPFTSIALRVEAELDVRGLAGWLAELEEGQRLLSVHDLSIAAPEPTAPATRAERLRAEFTVVGLSARALGGP